MKLTYTQAKQIISNHSRYDLEGFLETIGEQPSWLCHMGELESISEIQAILQGGCSSGAYMPAVTYYDALQCMSEYGNEVLDYIESCYGELPEIEKGSSWSGMAVLFCSYAVELYCSQFSDLLDNVNWD